ncbi:MAG: tryptophan-rich sensory protein [Oscillospiraceae bacterium]|nr:tryptophan-rich sensory protein [Oscillospiraceae bacterium]
MKSGKIKWKQLVICIAAPLLVGALAALLSREGMEYYKSMYKPLLAPPGWVFPVVWTILYVLMGLASYLVYTSAASPERIRRAMTAYVLQLAANFIWPLIFFVLQAYLAAFLWLILLFALALVCALRFGYIDARAGKLMTPYLLWLFFAAYLNLGVYLLN